MGYLSFALVGVTGMMQLAKILPVTDLKRLLKAKLIFLIVS